MSDQDKRIIAGISIAAVVLVVVHFLVVAAVHGSQVAGLTMIGDIGTAARIGGAIAGLYVGFHVAKSTGSQGKGWAAGLAVVFAVSILLAGAIDAAMPDRFNSYYHADYDNPY